MLSRKVISHSPEDTQRLGEKLGRLAQAGDVFCLVGELGAGKTCLTQGIARGLDILGHVSSPSFVLIREHRGRLPLYHIDLYRADRLEEVAALGLDDYLYGEGICVVEWAERAMSLLPPDHLLVRLEYLSETERRITFEPQGERYADLLSKLWN